MLLILRLLRGHGWQLVNGQVAEAAINPTPGMVYVAGHSGVKLAEYAQIST